MTQVPEVERNLKKTNTKLDKIENAMNKAEENTKYALEISEKTRNDVIAFARVSFSYKFVELELFIF